MGFWESTQIARTIKVLRGKEPPEPKGNSPQIKKTIETLKGRKCSEK